MSKITLPERNIAAAAGYLLMGQGMAQKTLNLGKIFLKNHYILCILLTGQQDVVYLPSS